MRVLEQIAIAHASCFGVRLGSSWGFGGKGSSRIIKQRGGAEQAELRPHGHSVARGSCGVPNHESRGEEVFPGRANEEMLPAAPCYKLRLRGALLRLLT